MTDRPIRDILAEAMRWERLGPVSPLWADSYEEAREPMRRRADHLMRLLADHGLSVVRVGDPKPEPAPPASLDIYRYGLVGRQVERIIRKGPGDTWLVISIEDSTETVEQTFTMAEASANCGLVLTDDPAARTVPGLGRQLAALNEIYRLNAESMAGPEA